MPWTRLFYLRVIERAKATPKAHVTGANACSSCGISLGKKGRDNFCRNCGRCLVPEELLAARELSYRPEISG